MQIIWVCFTAEHESEIRTVFLFYIHKDAEQPARDEAGVREAKVEEQILLFHLHIREF